MSERLCIVYQRVTFFLCFEVSVVFFGREPGVWIGYPVPQRDGEREVVNGRDESERGFGEVFVKDRIRRVSWQRR
ncbi:hypothetical protein COLO4_05125 [Corchorus olitorius]|uniref:Uncharacterized protein n=1 Tax=Corchorus olitorius TaxID=93759 RepID=A0A1R3KRT2_9ROSI|nr:hypothetical protein COLO4_05125 [Corchorus olitorius]